MTIVLCKLSSFPSSRDKTNPRSVNEIFDPDRVTPHYNRPSKLRAAGIVLDRATNYGVVRLELLEHLYDKLYIQRIKCERTGATPRAAIIVNRRVISATASPSNDSLRLKIVNEEGAEKEEEELDVDYIFTATGYRRDAHVEILQGCEELATGEGSDVKGENGLVKGKWGVTRDYRVKVVDGKVQDNVGIWLQGCNESTHGVSFFPLLEARINTNIILVIRFSPFYPRHQRWRISPEHVRGATCSRGKELNLPRFFCHSRYHSML